MGLDNRVITGAFVQGRVDDEGSKGIAEGEKGGRDR